MYFTSDFKKGLKIEYDSKPWVIVDFLHVNPGKGSAFVRTKIKNLITAQVLDITFKSGDKVGRPELETKDMKYLYNDKDDYIFMDNANYEQIVLNKGDIGDKKFFLKENDDVKISFFNGKQISIDLNTFVHLEVVDTTPNIKGDTSSGGSKPATLSTGLVINVPFHIVKGDLLKVDTRSSSYVEKIKS